MKSPRRESFTEDVIRTRTIEKGIEGLVHISQICEKKIIKPEDALKIGQKVNAKIINIDAENKKIELSIRELEELLMK